MSDENQLLCLLGAADLRVELAPASGLHKAKLIEEARKISVVTSPIAQEIAAEQIREIKTTLKAVEEQRKAIKSPILKAGRDIDDLAANYTKELESESARLQRLVNSYEAEKVRKAREEEDRVRREQEAADRKLREEREAAQRKIEEAKTASEVIQAESDMRRAQEEAIAKAREHSTRLVATAPMKVKKTASKTVPKFEVIDIKAVYAAHPELCILEISKSAVNRILSDGVRECPGLRIWEEQELQVR